MEREEELAMGSVGEYSAKFSLHQCAFPIPCVSTPLKQMKRTHGITRTSKRRLAFVDSHPKIGSAGCICIIRAFVLCKRYLYPSMIATTGKM